MAAGNDVDLVYVDVPHQFHCTLSKLFLSNGKHVIVEKPFALNVKEAQEMIDCANANNRFLMEAMWTRFFPAAQSLKTLIDSSAIGNNRYITAKFAFRSAPNYDDRLFNRELCGGSLLDVGVYPLSLMCFYKGMLPENVQVLYNKTETDVDGLCSFQMQFADESVGQGFGSLEVTTDQDMKLFGTEGWIELPDFWHPTRYIVNRPGQGPEVYEFSPENEGFHHEFDYAAKAILAGQIDQNVIPLDESLHIMEIMDGMREKMGVRYQGEE